MKKKRFLLLLLALLLAAFLGRAAILRTHTFTLSDRDGTALKAEQIQPFGGTVYVSGNCDTDVVFTDTETGETHTVGYITSGVTEKIRLPRGRWYTVQGLGNLTLRPVTLRIE